MCTLSIIPVDNGLIITGNRDEQRTRTEPGILHQTDNFCYPTDGLAGGTWIGLNRQGVAIALLNRYQNPLKSNMTTRGEIIPALLEAGNFEQVSKRCRQLALDNYNPFDLIIASQTGLLQLQYDGQKGLFIEHEPFKPFFITSSAVKMHYTLQQRQNIFDSFMAEKPNTPSDILTKLHMQKISGDDSTSILMSREKTHTKSICQLVITHQQSIFEYYTEDALDTCHSKQEKPFATYKSSFKDSTN